MCRSRRELSNEYLLAKIGFDTAKNEPCQICPLSAYRSPRCRSSGPRPAGRTAANCPSTATSWSGRTTSCGVGEGIQTFIGGPIDKSFSCLLDGYVFSLTKNLKRGKKRKPIFLMYVRTFLFHRAFTTLSTSLILSSSYCVNNYPLL